MGWDDENGDPGKMMRMRKVAGRATCRVRCRVVDSGRRLHACNVVNGQPRDEGLPGKEYMLVCTGPFASAASLETASTARGSRT